MTDLFGTESLTLQINVITIDGKKMTKAVFSQILPEDIYSITHVKEPENSFLLDVQVYGKPLGYVRLESTPQYNTKHILIWEKGGELRKCDHRIILYEQFEDKISIEQYNILKPIFDAPHLFIGG